MPITLAQAQSDLLSKLGIEDPAVAPDLQQQDVIIAINGAMQILQSAGEDYFTRQKLMVTLGVGTSVYSIAGVQSVLGPVRLDDSVPLRALESRGELDQFDRIFLGGTGYGSAAGTPMAYWIEYLRQGSTGNIQRVNIWLAPPPAADALPATLAVEVVDAAPSYSAADLATNALLPVSQNYAESIFLPIARYLITRSSQFSRPDILAGLTSDYQSAMQRLGFSGGFPNVDQSANKLQRKVNA
jgi:hypothetical protein